MKREVRVGINDSSPEEFELHFVENGDVRHAERIWQSRIDLLVEYVHEWHMNANVSQISTLHLKQSSQP